MNEKLLELIKYIKDIETLVSPARHLPADPIGVITGGYGETDKSLVRDGMVVTDELATKWLLVKLAKIEARIEALVPFRLTDGQLVSLIDFVYNLGIGSLSKSTLLKLILAGDFEAASEEFEKWNRANGKVLYGLTLRRKKEKSWFLGFA